MKTEGILTKEESNAKVKAAFDECDKALTKNDKRLLNKILADIKKKTM